MRLNPAQPRPGARHLDAANWYPVRAQNGPGIAVVEHRPGPDLSASLDGTEEH